MRILFILLIGACLTARAAVSPPAKATQAEVNAGLNNSKFVTPLTLQNKPGGGGGGGGSGVLITHPDGTSTNIVIAADTDAARGDALEIAFQLHGIGDVITIGPGIHDVGSTSLRFSNNASLYGLSRQASVIHGTTQSRLLVMNTNTIANLTITNDAGACLAQLFSVPLTSYSGLVLDRVTFYGRGADCMGLSKTHSNILFMSSSFNGMDGDTCQLNGSAVPKSGVIDSCDFHGVTSALNLGEGSQFVLRNSMFTATNLSSGATGIVSDGTNIWESCYISVADDGTTSVGVDINSGVSIFKGCFITNGSAGGTKESFDIAAGAQALVDAATFYDPAQVAGSGTVTAMWGNFTGNGGGLTNVAFNNSKPLNVGSWVVDTNASGALNISNTVYASSVSVSTNGSISAANSTNTGVSLVGTVKLGFSGATTVSSGYGYAASGWHTGGSLQTDSGQINLRGKVALTGIDTTTLTIGAAYTANTLGSLSCLDGIFGGTVTATNGFIVPQKTLTITGGTNVALNITTNYLGTYFLTCTTNAYFTQPTGLMAGQSFYVHVVQDAVGTWSVGFDTNYWKFPSGQILTTTTNAGAKSVLSCLVSPYGTNVFVIQSLNFQ